jgi:transposase-like protein
VRKRSKEEKRRIVEESFASGRTVAGVARAHGVRPGQIFEWRNAYKEGRLTDASAAPVCLRFAPDNRRSFSLAIPITLRHNRKTSFASLRLRDRLLEISDRFHGRTVIGLGRIRTQECTNFQDSLNEAQKAADALKQKYGANSSQYMGAQRAIDSYGKAGIDNGVVIKVGNTGSAGAQVQVGGVTGPKTKDNPSGQQIDVTFGTGQLGKGGAVNAGLSAHEGSHVADGSAWAASGFKDALNPTRYATESRAYRIQANIYEGQGYLYGAFSPTELMWIRGWPQSNVDGRIDYWLRIPKAQGGLYGVTPADKTKAFTPGARLRR